jgi:hypothetical protein
MNEIPENTSEQAPNIYLTKLREALDSKNKDLLRAVVDGIQINVHGTDKTHFSPLDDEDLDTLLGTGYAMINVGSGTRGQRIMIKDSELYMPPPTDPDLVEYVRENRMNFKRLFNLPDLPDNQELRVRF